MKRILFILLLLCSAPCITLGYDFEADGVYYTITSRIKRTVEVTHWEEMTGSRGTPVRIVHHHDCGHDHSAERLTSNHRRLIRLLHDVPPRVGNDVGLTMDFQDMIFYVPDNVLPLYQADDFWSKQNVQTINNCSFPLTETL